MARNRQVPEVFEAFPSEGFYTPQAEIRRWGLFAKGLRHRSRRRRRAVTVLAWTFGLCAAILLVAAIAGG
jgi:hypothetical protein